MVSIKIYVAVVILAMAAPAAPAAPESAPATTTPAATESAPAHLIAPESIIVKSPDPKGIFCYTPAICEGLNGRLITAVDFGGPGTAALDGPRSQMGDYESGNQIRVMLSDDGGGTWRQTPTRLPMMHEILFRDGRSLYILGHCGPLVISRSDDNGETWSAPSVLCPEPRWHQSAVAIDVYRGKITLVYEKFFPEWHEWPGVCLCLLQAKSGSDLTKAGSWNFSPLYNPDEDLDKAREAGIPEYVTPGPLETNSVRIYDRSHPLYDDSGRSLVLLSRANTGMADKAIVTRGSWGRDGSLMIDKWPGKYYVDFPGGNMKFDIVYDSRTRLYWLVHSVNIPGESDRRTLGLSYSRDLSDWKLAAIIARGASDRESRHYASLIIKGDDILIVSRSGDSDAANAHDTDIVTFHKVTDFRKLAVLK